MMGSCVIDSGEYVVWLVGFLVIWLYMKRRCDGCNGKYVV